MGDLSLRELADRLAADQQVDGSRWTADTVLAEALVWDSLAKAEVVELFAEHGHTLPYELLDELRTLGDLHHYLVAPGTVAVEGAGPAFRFVPITAADEPAVFRLHTEGEALGRYRLRGRTPSPEDFHRFLWDRVLTQYLVVEGKDIAGVVTAYEHDARHRYVHLAAVSAASRVDSGSTARAVLRFVPRLFAEFDLRKIYAEVLASNFERFRSGVGRRFDVEGRLRDHEYLDGGYEDVYVLATYRNRWSEPV